MWSAGLAEIQEHWIRSLSGITAKPRAEKCKIAYHGCLAFGASLKLLMGAGGSQHSESRTHLN